VVHGLLGRRPIRASTAWPCRTPPLPARRQIPSCEACPEGSPRSGAAKLPPLPLPASPRDLSSAMPSTASRARLCFEAGNRRRRRESLCRQFARFDVDLPGLSGLDRDALSPNAWRRTM
jgi:hypothetical protein